VRHHVTTCFRTFSAVRLITRITTGPRSKWLTFGVWILLLIISMAANLPGRFSDAEKNESRSFLPGSAESTKVLDVTERLSGAETAPTVIVYHRDGGLTRADRAHIERDVRRLNRATRAFSNTTPFGNPSDPDASPPYLLAPDGATALIGNIIKATDTGESAQILDPIDRYRELVSDPGGGLQVKVTGPSGLSADAIKVFEGINTTLIGAALLLVIVLLILIYRSPVFWFFPILAVVFAELGARSFGWVLTSLGVTVNGQSSAILSILVIGAGTDYALLLVARYREELRRHQDKHEAMALALRRAGPAIFASGLTVMATLLSLSLAKVNGTAGLGPIGALGIGVAVLVMLTFLPALLTIVGRRPFWPFVPYGPEGTQAPDHTPMRVPGLAGLVDRLGPGVTTFAVIGVLAVLGALAGAPLAGAIVAVVVLAIGGLLVGPYRRLRAGRMARFEARMHAREHAVDETHGWWRRVGEAVARRPAVVGGVGVAVLLVMCLGLLNFSDGLTQSNQFRNSVESIEGQRLLEGSFPSGQAAPTDIIVQDPAQVAAVIGEALALARAGRPGPVLVDIPRDVQEAAVDAHAPAPSAPAAPAPAPVADALVARMRDELRASRRPVLYVGGGVLNAGAGAPLRAVAERLRVPVVTTLMGKSAFPEDHELFFGWPGMHGAVWANRALHHADLLVAVGARFDDRVTGRLDRFAPGARVVHVDVDARELGKLRRADVAVRADARLALQPLADATADDPPLDSGAWLEQLRAWRADHPLRFDRTAATLKPQRAIELAAQLGADRDLVWTTGVGQHQMWAMQYATCRAPRSFITSGGHGTMGFGLPAAIGAKAARPEATVVCVDGDGSFQMCLQEVATSVAERLAVVVLILNNGHLGMVQQWQTMYFDERLSHVDLTQELPDYAALARSLGAHGVTVHTEDELRVALRAALDATRTTVIDARVERFEQCYPMIPPGAAAVDMVEWPG